VNHLEQFMRRLTPQSAEDRAGDGEGRVHDIGKNLVEIILKNNGYDVVNLDQGSAGRTDQGVPAAPSG